MKTINLYFKKATGIIGAAVAATWLTLSVSVFLYLIYQFLTEITR